ncbi:MAG: branched-chain amino acid ABC transporter substrate-binding protein [Hyphomicrobiales bacterium]|nr:branched-chain amino acid ABC transporter substrate-binding protein [Hyphomicrobiales bacterium]
MKTLLAATLAALGLSAALAPARAQDVTVAVAGPMTGGEATFGAQFLAGAKAAVEDINAAGGVMGKKIKLEIGDDACNPTQAKAVAEKLAGLKVPFVAGHFCTGSSIPASKVYNEEGIIQISPASTGTKYTDERPGPYSFRVCGRDDQQGGVAGAYLAKNFGDKKIAILHDKSAYGQGLAEETKKAFNKAGKTEVLFDTVAKGEKDFSAVVSKLKQAGADVVYYGGYHSEAGLIIKQMRAQGMKTILVGGDALVSAELWQITGDDGEGTLMTFSPDARKLPSAAALVAKFKAAGVEPEGYVLYTYAAFQTWKQAVEKAKSMKAEDVVKVLASAEFDTAIGKYKFDKKGDPILEDPYTFYRWSKGTYAQIN